MSKRKAPMAARAASCAGRKRYSCGARMLLVFRNGKWWCKNHLPENRK